MNQFRYLRDVEGFPVYQDTDIEFYGEASEAYSKLIEDVEGAHSFIYLEYFAVQCSTAFMNRNSSNMLILLFRLSLRQSS